MPDGLVLHPEGRLDLESSGPLRQRLAHAFASGVLNVVVELPDVTEIDVTGVAVLAGAARHLESQGGGLVLRGPQPLVATALRVNGLGALVEPARRALMSAG
jgi:anti-anti-sigma factor